jgi:choice-of-anchor B domain-containing protein
MRNSSRSFSLVGAHLAAMFLVMACSESPTEPLPDGDVATISVTPAHIDFDALGVTTQATAVARDDGGEQVSATFSFAMKGTGVATVSTNGTVTAQGNGKDTLLVTADGVTAKVEVLVQQVATSLAVDGPVNLTVLGQLAPLAVTARDRNNRSITGGTGGIVFTSSNPLAVPVTQSGVVAAARPGTSEITVTSGTLNTTTTVNVTLTGPVGGPRVGAETPCTSGMAGPFPCSNIKLMSYLPKSGVGAGDGIELNDLWGWVDPQTNREYAIVMRRDGTAFVDVTDPLNPTFLGFLPIPAGAQPNTWHDVKVYANHAFIVADGAGAHGVQVFDLTTLRGVTTPQTFSVVTRYTNVASAHNIFINEATGFAYSVGGSSGGTTCGGGLHMINIQSPANPTFAGCFADPQTGRLGTGYTHDVQCVVYAGPDATYTGREICFGSNETAISISDVTLKSAPVAVSRASYPGVAYTHQGWLTPDQRYFFVNDELDEGNGIVTATRTLVWDVTDLDDPVLLTQYLGPTNATDHNHYIRGNRMYMSNYQFGLRVVDVTTPAAPVQLGFFDTAPTRPNSPGFAGSWSNYPFFPSGNIVMTSRDEGLFVLRTTN